MKKIFSVFCISMIILISGCGKRSPDADIPRGGTVVIALPADADALNPILWSGSSTGTVLQFLFPDLLEMDLDSSSGKIVFKPALAKSWEWNGDGTSLTYHLRTDAAWEDGVPVTAHDIKYSYVLYAHPDIPGVRKNYLQYFLRNDKDEPDIDQSVLVPDDSTITFRFSRAYEKSQQMAHTQLNFVPKHIAGKIEPSKWVSSEFNSRPVTGKHYRLHQWNRKQDITLVKNEKWAIPHEAYPDRIVFRIIPDMNTRLIELQSGSVDIVEGLSPDDARRIMKSGGPVRIEKQSFRRFDYIGWNNIDKDVYQKTKGKVIRPHPLFGDRKVRRALTMAINRNSLIGGWLGEFGQESTGPVSPAFAWAYHDSLKPLPFDPEMAKELLREAGWDDHDRDGILDRNGRKFELTLVSNTGNPRREFAMQKIQDDLKQVGISCRLQLLESNVFSAGLKKKTYDAFIGGISASVTLDLTAQFGSDFRISSFNYYGYQNQKVDSLIRVMNEYRDITEAGPVVRRIQELIYEDQPVTFLYWFDNLVGIHRRVMGTSVDFLSPYHKFYDWHLSLTH